MSTQMSAAEAKAHQDELAKHFSLYFWYGTWCDKCCGIYPKVMSFGSSVREESYYQCEVCGKRTKPFEMPWQARDAWNAEDTYFEESQMTLW